MKDSLHRSRVENGIFVNASRTSGLNATKFEWESHGQYLINEKPTVDLSSSKKTINLTFAHSIDLSSSWRGPLLLSPGCTVVSDHVIHSP